MSAENNETENAEDDDEEDDDAALDEEVFEVEKVLSICYGDPKEIRQRGLYLKVIYFILLFFNCLSKYCPGVYLIINKLFFST